MTVNWDAVEPYDPPATKGLCVIVLGGPAIEDVRDALKKPVPKAAMVSAIVARQWHLGLADDAARRAKPWHVVATFMALRGRPNEHAEAMADYFDGLEGDHRELARGALR